MEYYDECVKALEKGASVEDLAALPVREQIGRFKYVDAEEAVKTAQGIRRELSSEIGALLEKEEY